MPVVSKIMNVKLHKIRALLLAKLIRLLYFILREEVRPVISVSAIIVRQNKFLVLDLTYFKGYCLPGGHVNAGETLEEALEREVSEETGLRIVAQKYFNSYANYFHKFPKICTSFIVEAEGKLKDSEEGKLLWLTAAELKGKFAYKDNEMALKDYLSL